MSDPRRLLDDPSLLAIDRAVLRSAERDAPSEHARRAAKMALGIGASGGVLALAGKTAVAPSHVAAWSTLLKLSVVVIVAGGAVALFAGARRSSPPAETAAVVVAPSAPATVVKSEVTSLPPEPIAAPTAVVAVADLPSAVVAPAKGAPARNAVAVGAAPAPGTGTAGTGRGAEREASSIAEEVAALDGARARLRAGDAQGAVERLAAYDAAYPKGILAGEASSLRVDAYLALGNEVAAKRAAKSYVDAYPTSPEAPRLRRLLEEGPGTHGARAPEGRAE